MRTVITEMDVRLHGSKAGVLSRTDRNEFSFRYDPVWLARPDAVPLSSRLPLRPDAFPARLTERWFNGLLPEGPRRERLARLVDTVSQDTWSLLRAAAGECAGAVQGPSSLRLRQNRQERWIALRASRWPAHRTRSPFTAARTVPGRCRWTGTQAVTFSSLLHGNSRGLSRTSTGAWKSRGGWASRLPKQRS